jgi:acetyltransferase EpsM
VLDLIYNDVFLVGYSGHSFVVMESLQKSKIAVTGYISPSEAERNPFDLLYCGSEDDPDFFGWKSDSVFVLAVGDNIIRRKIGNLIRGNNKTCLTLIDKDANVSRTAIVGSGSYVSSSAVIQSLVTIGEDVIVNTGSIVEHECVIGYGTHIAPGATILGNVHVGNNVFIGANSVVKQGIKIQDNVVVGAGAVVLADIEEGQTVVGNPAKPIVT